MAKKKKLVKKPVKKNNAKKTVAKKTVAKKKIVKKIAAKKTATKKKVAPKAKNTKKIAQKNPVKVTQKVTAKKPMPKATVKASVKTNVDYTKAVTPLGDRLVVRLAEGEKMTAGGLHIPDMVNTAVGYLRGEVLVVGHGQQNKKGFIKSMDVQKGDQILFSEHAGTKVIFNSEELHIVNETDVLGIIQNK